YAADVDGDGDIDALSASFFDNTIAWYENTAGDGSTWTKRAIATDAEGAASVYAADVDGDGDIDALSASSNDDTIAWYENTAGDGSAWTFHGIATDADAAKSVYAVDVDGDGDMDALSASAIDGAIAWYPNHGGQLTLAATDVAPTTLTSGEQAALLRILATHNGRSGDSDAQLTELALRLEDGAGTALTTAQAQALFANLHIYRDDGSGDFDPSLDTLVATVAGGVLSLSATGVQLVAIAPGNADAAVAFGAPVTFFAVAELTAAADAQTPNALRMTLVNTPAPNSIFSQAVDRNTLNRSDGVIDLDLTCPTDVTSAAVTALADTAVLTVTKVLVPDTDPGLFILAAGDQTGTEAGNGAIVTATVDVGATVAFTETAGSNTYLYDYATTFRCDDPAGAGGTAVNGSLTMPAADVTCTITNTRLTGDITFVKVVEGGNASPSDWTFSIRGGPSGIPHGATRSINTGFYVVEESGPPDYILTDVGGECWFGEGGIYLTVSSTGGTCTFTNTAIIAPAVQIVESYTVSRVEEGKITGEGSRACYWITLTSDPGSGNVAIIVGPPVNGQVTLSKSTVVLDGANWNNLSPDDRSNFVCVVPVDDAIDDGGAQVCHDGNTDVIGNGTLVTAKECGDHTDSIPHRIGSATAPDYTTATPIQRKQPDGAFADESDVPVLIQDDDTAGVLFTESFGVTDLDEDGTPVDRACYWVTLTSQPTADVTVTPRSDGQVTVTPPSVVINAQ
ncbi:MAG: VCBS repeat-containing protein, partial [Caldilineaceae bacterium]|nr:VCBS repeat-containing protein [Caldilineaceae bacterium]